MSPERQPQILKSLDLALRLLECFDDGRRERGVTDLARELGVSKATVYRILATLQRRAYVMQNPVTERYRLGPRLRQLGHVAATRIDLAVEARPYMEYLRDVTGDTVHLAILDGPEVVYIAKVEGTHPVQVVSHIGDRCPAHAVSTGKVLLAYAEPATLERILSTGLPQFNHLTHAAADDLRAELARIREAGYAINWGEWREEVRGVAAPLRDASGQVIAALGICSHASRLTEVRIAALTGTVVDIAARLSAHLGGRWPAGERVPTEAGSS